MPSKIIISARSMLARNVYSLLLKHRSPEIIATEKFEQARPWFYRLSRLDLAIFHSDVFAPRFDHYFQRLMKDEPFAEIPKIFVCKSSPREKDWQKKLKKLPNSIVIERPFSVDDFESKITGVLNGS